MKKIILIIFLMFLLIGCSEESFSVKFYDEEKLVHINTIKSNNLSFSFDINDKEGYTFLGWYEGETKFDFSKPILKNYELYAKWSINTYTITFLDEDGEVLLTEELEYNETITPPINPTKEAVGNKVYTFSGWDIKFDKATSDMIIFATYTFSYNYTVTFYNYDDSINETFIIKEGNKATFLDYTRDSDIRYDYTFIGWFKDLDDIEPYDFNSEIIENTKLYPKFSKVRKVVEFDGLKVSFLGDSITTFYSESSIVNSYYNGENQYYYPLYSSTVKRVEDTWWYKLTDKANLKLGINNSWSGSSCYNFGSESNSAAMNLNRINTLAESGTPDIIVINIGTNDNVNSVSDYHFRFAYSKMLDRIEKAYPNALIFCATLGYSAYTGYGYTEARRQAYNQIIREIVKDKDHYIIALDEIQTIDTYKSILGDALHPNANGMSLYAQKAYETLLKELKLVD